MPEGNIQTNAEGQTVQGAPDMTGGIRVDGEPLDRTQGAPSPIVEHDVIGPRGGEPLGRDECGQHQQGTVITPGSSGQGTGGNG
jgi:hypothetical protein